MIEHETQPAHPPVVSRDRWLQTRLELLQEEKEHTRTYDRINAKRRRLPMVKVESQYRFVGPDGEKTLLELFEGRQQLIVYHFMFGPDWEAGCPGCTSYINAIGDLSDLANRNTSMVIVSRAPIEKLTAYRAEKGWTLPWYSSFQSEFNYDFGVTLDPSREGVGYNYKSGDEFAKGFGPLDRVREMPGTSVFFRVGDDVFHTYSCFARGGEALTDSYRLLDITPYGRQEDFEDSPEGWPQKPTYG